MFPDRRSRRTSRSFVRRVLVQDVGSHGFAGPSVNCFSEVQQSQDAVSFSVSITSASSARVSSTGSSPSRFGTPRKRTGQGCQ